MSSTATNTGRKSSATPVKAGPGRPGGGRLPSPPKRRRSGLIGLAVLLIVGSAAVAGLVAVRIDSRTEVIKAARPIVIGQQITRADLDVTRVASEGLSLVPSSQSGGVIGKYAAQAIPAGRLLDTAMLQEQGYLKAGVVAVGVLVAQGRMPANGLQQGDRVQVIQVVDGTAKVLVDSAVVSTPPAAAAAGGGGGIIPGGSSQGPGGVATVIVTSAKAPSVAAASAANQLSLVLVDRGSQLGN